MHTEPDNSDYGKVLLPIARATISNALGLATQADERASWLQQQAACFVTLMQKGELRGCVGTLIAHRTLLQDVKANALAAAFRDTRFAPLLATELGLTRVEVSLLSAIKPLVFASENEALQQLEPGAHGVVFEYGQHRSTFLPQVWQQLPSVDEFMAQLKIKAGVSADFWADGVKLSCYSVSKWQESDLLETVDASR
ncbi:MAG: AmmeMemoRadiSam system protein A [Gallionellaceae bacterium]